MILLTNILKHCFMVAVWGLYNSQRLAYVIQVFSRLAVSMLQRLVSPIRGLDSALKIGDQTIARVLCRIAIAPQCPIKNDHAGCVPMEVCINGLEGVFGRVDHQAKDQRCHHHKNVSYQANDGVGVLIPVVGGQLWVPLHHEKRGSNQAPKNAQCDPECGFHGHPATYSMNIRPLIPR
ncbi:hypothetical protein D3C84_502930 [compost metagenome]